MAMTAPQMQLPGGASRHRFRLNKNLGWLAVAVALAAAAVLTVAVVDSDSSEISRTGADSISPVLVERGSINAIDHRTQLESQVESQVESFNQQNGTNIPDYRGPGSSAGDHVGPGLMEHGSITAIDHATAKEG